MGRTRSSQRPSWTARPATFEWAPDSKSLYVEEANGAAIWQLDALTPAPPRVIATDATLSIRPFRRPTGGAILINRLVDGVPQIVLLDLASGDETLLVAGQPAASSSAGCAGHRTATR